jgi:hypothetical protein
MSETLANELNEISTETGINKSTLCRMGISRIVRDFQSNGLMQLMGDFTRQYPEIV